jgi:hypothetical protein
VGVLITGCSGGDDSTDEQRPNRSTQPTAESSAPSPTTADVPSTPATEPLATTVPAEVTTVPAVSFPIPSQAPALGALVPRVDGFELVESDDDVPWYLYRLPDGVAAYHAGIAAPDGTFVGRLLIVQDDGQQPDAFDRYVEVLFDGSGTQFKAGEVQDPSGGTFVTSNGSPSMWIELEGAAVLRADEPDGGELAQWTWRDQHLLWIVRGPVADVEPYVRGILRAQSGALDPYDMQGMTGDLYDHMPDVEGYTYFDGTRSNTLEPDLPDPECVERFYTGYIRTDGDDAAFRDSDLSLNVLKSGSGCVANGYVADIQARYLALPGATEEDIAGVAVVRGDEFIQFAVGDTILQLSSPVPATFVTMAPFIEQFIAGQPDR